MLTVASLAAAQFNPHDFLRHPGQQFRSDATGTQFSQQITHANPQPQFQPQFQQFQPQPQFQRAPVPPAVDNQRVAQAISQLTPSQIASFLQQQNPAFAQPQFQPQPQRHFVQPQPQPRPSFQPQPLQAQPQPQPAAIQTQPAAVQFANVGAAPGGEYQFGFHTGNQPGAKDNSFREEVRLPDGTVKGAYGYVDANGKQRIVRYTAGKEGFKVRSQVTRAGQVIRKIVVQVEGDIHPDPAPAAPAQPAPSARQQAAPAAPAQFAPQPQGPQTFNFGPATANGGPGAALASFLGQQG